MFSWTSVGDTYERRVVNFIEPRDDDLVADLEAAQQLDFTDADGAERDLAALGAIAIQNVDDAVTAIGE